MADDEYDEYDAVVRIPKGERLADSKKTDGWSRGFAPNTSEMLGHFRARVTRDGEAMARDGQPYFAMNRLPEVNPAGEDRELFEIQFADGLWMLVREDDLVAGVIKPDR
jgi:hypothetical protein